MWRKICWNPQARKRETVYVYVWEFSLLMLVSHTHHYYMAELILLWSNWVAQIHDISAPAPPAPSWMAQEVWPLCRHVNVIILLYRNINEVSTCAPCQWWHLGDAPATVHCTGNSVFQGASTDPGGRPPLLAGPMQISRKLESGMELSFSSAAAAGKVNPIPEREREMERERERESGGGLLPWLPIHRSVRAGKGCFPSDLDGRNLHWKMCIIEKLIFPEVTGSEVDRRGPKCASQ